MSKQAPVPIVKRSRVRVTNQNSEYRNQLGRVARVDEDNIWVRIDGHERRGMLPFKPQELCHSTLESPVEYDLYVEAQKLLLPYEGG